MPFDPSRQLNSLKQILILPYTRPHSVISRHIRREPLTSVG